MICPNCKLEIDPAMAFHICPHCGASTEVAATTVSGSVLPDAAVPATRVLLIEDDTMISEIYRRQLTLAHFDVATASDGAAGEQALQDGQFAVVLLDLMLPKVNGLDILKKMQQDSRLSSLPVIVLSNLDQTDVIEEVYACGAKKFLNKSSITPADLISAITAVT